jgi:hypothetical protein
VKTLIILRKAICLDQCPALRTVYIDWVTVHFYLHFWRRLAPARQPFHSKRFVNDCHIIVWAPEPPELSCKTRLLRSSNIVRIKSSMSSFSHKTNCTFLFQLVDWNGHSIVSMPQFRGR